MKQFVLIDSDGKRFGEFEAANQWKAWSIAVKLAAYPKPRPSTWSLLIQKEGSLIFMGGMGPNPARAEKKIP